MSDVGVAIKCPACDTVIDVPITVQLVQQGDRQYLNCDPDMTDLWAHAWSHGAEGNYGDLERDPGDQQ